MQPNLLYGPQDQWTGRISAPAGLRLRLGPGTEYPDIAILPFQEAVRVLGNSADWLYVEHGDGQGFVFQKWVDRLTDSDLAVPVVDLAADLAATPEQRLALPPNASDRAALLVDAWNRYGGLLTAQSLELGLEPKVALAVLLAESLGEPFGADGRMTIRFEPHIFYFRWGRQHPSLFQQHFRYSPDHAWNADHQHDWRPIVDSPWRGIHTDQANEWAAFQVARTLDDEAALSSISMGAPQIMGFNHATVGYSSPQAMFTDFSSGARPQIASLFRYMQQNRLVQAVRNQDFLAFARAYNGIGQEELYAQRMRDWLAVYADVAGDVQAAPGAADVMPMPGALPLPDATGSAAGGKPLAEADPQLYAAWRQHIEQGFQNNQDMFQRILAAFMTPYYTTIWMYRILFGLGIAAFAVAVFMALRAPDASTAIWTSAIFGGLSVATFLGYFLSRPLQALEENLQFITWLGLIYNTYWSRLVNSTDPTTFHQMAEDATNDAVGSIKEMLDKHAEHNGKRPGLR